MSDPEKLATRVRSLLADREDVVERRMMGGLVFMVGGHMACGVDAHGLMVRVGRDGYEDALDEPDARVMDFTGRPMRGFVFADVADADDERLRAWVMRGVAFVTTLPPK